LSRHAKLSGKPRQDAQLATSKAGSGSLVIAGLRTVKHGHVVVIVQSKGSKYPIGYSGRFGSIGRKNASINWS